MNLIFKGYGYWHLALSPDAGRSLSNKSHLDLISHLSSSSYHYQEHRSLFNGFGQIPLKTTLFVNIFEMKVSRFIWKHQF